MIVSFSGMDFRNLIYAELKTFFLSLSFPSSPPPQQVKARETENMF